MDINQLLEEMIQRGASDLHLTAGTPPMFRIDGVLVPSNYEVLNPELTRELSFSLLGDDQIQRFEKEHELDFSFGVPHLSRFRANAYVQRGCVTLAVRTIPFEIPSFKELGLPSVVADFAARPKGLVLVTGPTGCGKSTTLAALLDKINHERRAHIVTVEDPIEYVFHHRKCIVNQRQIGTDTHSFQRALKYVLRQDPDVVMIGEMRDLETTSAALTISETGHLTFATLHTNSAAESIDRIIDIYPTHRQSQVRSQLSFVLVGVVTQALVPKLGGGRVLALELLIATPAVKALIRDDKVHQIYSMVQAGRKYGMMTMNQSLQELYFKRQISQETALSFSRDPEELNAMIQQKRLTVAS